MLGATIQHHLDQQPDDNVMKTGNDLLELEKFKQEATEILEGVMFPLHNWESNVETLESEECQTPRRFWVYRWIKEWMNC